MRARFIGEYTHGRTALLQYGVTFTGHAPVEVTAEVAAWLAGHPEFEVMGEPDAPKPARRKKVRAA